MSPARSSLLICLLIACSQSILRAQSVPLRSLAKEPRDRGVLSRGWTVRGVVIGDEQKPEGGVSVVAWWVEREDAGLPGVKSHATQTDGRGEFTIRDLPAGIDVRLIAQVEDECSGPPVRVKAGSSVPINLRISRENTIALGGRVVDEYGTPIPGVEVTVESRMRTPEGIFWEQTLLAPESGPLLTDSEGRYQTPRRLRRDCEHRAWAAAPEKEPRASDWFAPTTPSFFDIVIEPNPKPEHATILADYDAGWTAYRQGNYSEAERWFEATIEEADRLQVQDLRLWANWLMAESDSLLALGKYADAETFARDALILRVRTLGLYHPTVVDNLIAVALALDRQGKHASAGALLFKAVLLREKIRGPDHPEYARTLLSVAVHYDADGKPTNAERLYRSALRILERAYGPDAWALAYPLVEAGRNATTLGKYAEAESLFQRALRIGEASMGPRHPFVAEVLENQAWLLRTTGRAGEAQALEARGRAIRSPR